MRIEAQGTGGRAVVEGGTRPPEVDGHHLSRRVVRLPGRLAQFSYGPDPCCRDVVMRRPRRAKVWRNTGSWFADSERRVELSLRPSAAWVLVLPGPFG